MMDPSGRPPEETLGEGFSRAPESQQILLLLGTGRIMPTRSRAGRRADLHSCWDKAMNWNDQRNRRSIHEHSRKVADNSSTSASTPSEAPSLHILAAARGDPATQQRDDSLLRGSP